MNMKRKATDENSSSLRCKERKLDKEVEEKKNISNDDVTSISTKRIKPDSKNTTITTLKISKRNELSGNWKQLVQTLNQGESNSTKSKKGTRHRKSHIKDRTASAVPSKRKYTDNAKVKNSDIWFDDVDDILIDILKKEKDQSTKTLVKPDSFQGPTKHVAIDCEMVGTGYEGRDNMLARVSVVNQYGQCLYDKYVKPTEKVTDYRTKVSGITPGHLAKGFPFKTVQKEVSDLLKDRILVGHAIHNDLKVLFLDHPRKSIRDTSRYKPFRRLFQGRNPSLKKLTEEVLGVKVQEGEHDSVQDAQATMRLYTMYRKQWEKDIKMKCRGKGAAVKSGKKSKG